MEEQMKYKVIDNPNYTNVMVVGIKIEPENEPLKFFFTTMRLHTYPELIQDILNDRGYLGDPQGVIFYSDLDEEDFANNDIFAEDHVKIYHHVFGECIIQKTIFKKMVYDFSSKLLVAYNQNQNLPNNWHTELKRNLEILKKQI